MDIYRKNEWASRTPAKRRGATRMEAAAAIEEGVEELAPSLRGLPAEPGGGVARRAAQGRRPFGWMHGRAGSDIPCGPRRALRSQEGRVNCFGPKAHCQP